MSVLRPVICDAPCVKLVVMPATRTPRPTCAGLVPPTPGWAPPAFCRTWLRVSWNWVCDDLKPVVLTLAMLLPVTSSMVWWLRRPLMPEKSERSMGVPFGWSCAGSGCGGGDGGDGVEGDVLVAHLHRRDRTGVGHRLHDARVGPAVGVGPGDLLPDELGGGHPHLQR